MVYEYDSTGKCVRAKYCNEDGSESGYYETYEYDSEGNIVKSIWTHDDTIESIYGLDYREVIYEYDSNGNIINIPNFHLK